MEDRNLEDLHEDDRAEAAAFIESHGGAIVLRVIDGEWGELLGLNAKRYMLVWRKKFGELPKHDFVWVGGPNMPLYAITGLPVIVARSGGGRYVGTVIPPPKDRMQIVWDGLLECNGGLYDPDAYPELREIFRAYRLVRRWKWLPFPRKWEEYETFGPSRLPDFRGAVAAR